MRTLLWSAIVAQLALIIAGAALGVLTGAPALDAALGAASTLAFPAIGGILLRSRPEHPISQLFAVANLGWAVNNFSGSYVRYSVGVTGLPGSDIATWTYTWPGFVSIAAYAVLLILFPDGRPLNGGWGLILRFIVAWMMVGSVAVAFASGPIDASVGVEVANPFAAPEPIGGLLAAVAPVAFAGALVLFAVAAISLIARWRGSRGVVRQQLKWFAAAAALVALTTVAFGLAVAFHGSVADLPPWGQVAQGASIASPALLPIAAAFAILRYRLYDIDRLINRTLVYGALSALLLGTYVLSVLAFSALLRPLTGSGELAVAGSTLLVVALFQPLRRRVQGAVDRRFYRSRYDATRTLDRFGTRLREQVDLDDVRADLLGAVHETVRPAHASVWLREAGR